MARVIIAGPAFASHAEWETAGNVLIFNDIIFKGGSCAELHAYGMAARRDGIIRY